MTTLRRAATSKVLLSLALMLLAPGVAQMVRAAAATPGICGAQPLCAETDDFVGTVASFRTGSAGVYKVITVTVRFQNKTAQPLILGYVANSGIATDDRGNRYIVYGQNAFRGIGLVSGRNFDPRFTLRPGGSADAQFELMWRPRGKELFGSTFALDLTVAKIDPVEGNQYILGGEFPLHFQGLVNGASAAAPLVGISAPLSGLSNTAEVSAQAADGQAAATVSKATNAVASIGSIFKRKKAAQNAAQVAGAAAGSNPAVNAAAATLGAVAGAGAAGEAQQAPAGATETQPPGLSNAAEVSAQAPAGQAAAGQAAATVSKATSAVASIGSIFKRKKAAQNAAQVAGAAAGDPAVNAAAATLDKLNEATKKLNQASQQSSQQHTPGGQVFSGGGSLSSGLGATSTEGWTNFSSCMAQAAGSHEKLTAQVLQRKLDQSKNLSPQQRSNIEQDIQWLTAKAAGGRGPAPDPKNPQRYLLELTDDEQMEISGANNRFNAEVHEKCEAQYGGMSQFADPAGRRKAAIDTRVPLPDLRHATPPPPAAKRRSALEQHNNCMASMQGLRWQIMAERMERRLQSLSNLSAQERKTWEEDIAVVRGAASNGGTAMPQSPDPKNPMRYLTRLTTDDQMALNQDYATRRQELMANCTGGPAKSNWSMATSKTAQRQAEAGTNAQLAPTKADAARAAQAWLDAHPMTAPSRATTASAPAAGGGSLSAGLGATRADYLRRGGAMECFDRIKGFRAKQTADRLASKRGSVSAQEHQDLEAWITAWRAAEEARLDEPTRPNPGDSQGYLKFLTKADQQELNMAYSAVHNKIMTECNAIDHMQVGDKKTRVR